MADIKQFDAGSSLKNRFRNAMKDSNFSYSPAETIPVASDENPKSAGEFLYILYRLERTNQNFEEWKWSSLMLTQKLVWERLAERLGIRFNG